MSDAVEKVAEEMGAIPPTHLIHEWTPTKYDQLDLPIEFMCTGCLKSWGWKKEEREWGYL